MSYSIFYQNKAIREYDDAVDWYSDQSERAAVNFRKAVAEKVNILRSTPSIYKRTYRTFYEVALSKYPYSIVYSIDEAKKIVIISSVFHHSRNPKIKFK